MNTEELKKSIANWEGIPPKEREEAFIYAYSEKNEDALADMLKKEIISARLDGAESLYYLLPPKDRAVIVPEVLTFLAREEAAKIDDLQNFYNICEKNGDSIFPFATKLCRTIISDAKAAPNLISLVQKNYDIALFGLSRLIKESDFDAVKKLVEFGIINHNRDLVIISAFWNCIINDCTIDPIELITLLEPDLEERQTMIGWCLIECIADDNKKGTDRLLKGGARLYPQNFDHLQGMLDVEDLGLDRKSQIVSLIDIDFKKIFGININFDTREEDFKKFFKTVMSNHNIRMKVLYDIMNPLKDYADALGYITEINYAKRGETQAMDFVEAVVRRKNGIFTEVEKMREKKIKASDVVDDVNIKKLLTDVRIASNDGYLLTSGISGAAAHFIGQGIAPHISSPENIDSSQIISLQKITSRNAELRKFITESEKEIYAKSSKHRVVAPSSAPAPSGFSGGASSVTSGAGYGSGV